MQGPPEAREGLRGHLPIVGFVMGFSTRHACRDMVNCERNQYHLALAQRTGKASGELCELKGAGYVYIFVPVARSGGTEDAALPPSHSSRNRAPTTTTQTLNLKQL